MVMELDGNGAVTAKYIRRINLIYAEDGAGTNRQYYLFNGHGDVVQLTSDAETLIKAYDYDAFGNEKNPNPADTNPFRYSGEYFDKEMCTIYLRARYYDASVGRFTQEDPACEGLNWYTYCGNDPINFFDPFGLERLVISGGYYSSTSDYPYVFIDSALKELLSYTGDEKSTLFIANVGLTQNDIDTIASYSDFYGFGVKYFTDTSELNEYITMETISIEQMIQSQGLGCFHMDMWVALSLGMG